MNKEFEHFLPLATTTKEQILTDGLIVLDTNVLLNIYRYSPGTRNDFINLLKNDKIINRLWLPYQVAYEFHKNRPNVIYDQKTPHDEISKLLKRQFESLIKKINGINIHKHHPFIDTDSVIKKLEDSCSTIIDELKTNADNHPDLIADDQYLSQIHEIFKGKYGKLPDENTEKSFIDNGKKRFKKNIPPGYMDRAKETDDKYGDYILWEQIIEKATLDDLDVVFVTDDNKEDWWLKVGVKTIGPRPELREEFTKKTGKQIIMYNSISFFKYAQKLVDIIPSKQTLDEMSDISNHQTHNDLYFLKANEKFNNYINSSKFQEVNEKFNNSINSRKFREVIEKFNNSINSSKFREVIEKLNELEANEEFTKD